MANNAKGGSFHQEPCIRPLAFLPYLSPVRFVSALWGNSVLPYLISLKRAQKPGGQILAKAKEIIQGGREISDHWRGVATSLL